MKPLVLAGLMCFAIGLWLGWLKREAEAEVPEPVWVHDHSTPSGALLTHSHRKGDVWDVMLHPMEMRRAHPGLAVEDFA